MASASSEPKKRQQGFAISSTVAPIQHSSAAASAGSPAFGSPAAKSSYIDTSYLLDDEMWRTMTVDADISKGPSQEPAQRIPCEDSTQADAVMEDLSNGGSALNGQPDAQPQDSRYPWDDGLHHLDDWLGLPPWSGAEDGSSATAITPEKIGNTGAFDRPSSILTATPDSGRGTAQRTMPRLDGSPFTESSFSTGESMSSSEQTTSVQSSSVLSSSSPAPRLSSTAPTEKPVAPPSATATAAAKPKRQRSVTVNTSTAAPESVSTILENSRTGRTSTSGASSSRRAVSANGRSDGASKESKASVSADRSATSKEATNGGVGKATRVKAGRTRRTSIGPAALVGSSSGKKGSPSSAPLHIDTSSAAATMSSGPQTFNGMPTMAWNSSPWPAGMYHHPPPHWGHFAPGGLPYGTFPPGWPVWGSPQSMPMHPAWSLPMNGSYIPTPTPGGSSMQPAWPADANPEGSLSPGVVQSLSLPMTSSMQGIFSSMQGLHVGTAGVGLDQEGTQHLQASDAVRPPFQPTGQANSWSETGASLATQGPADAGHQKSPSVSFGSTVQQDGAFPWNTESFVQKLPSEAATKPSSQSDHDERLSEEPPPRKDGSGRSSSTSPPALGVTAPRSASSLPTATIETSGHQRKSSRSLNRTSSLRGSKLEDVPEGETVHSHSPPASFSRGRVSAPTAPTLQTQTSTSAKPGIDGRRLSDSRRVQLPGKTGDSKKKKEAVQDDDDDGDDDNLLEGEDDDDDDDVDEDDDVQEDSTAPSRKPTRGRGSGSSRPVRSEQERRKRRRESHNLVERRRRDTINERIAELASLLPEAMLLDAIAHSQGGGNNSKVVQVAVPEEILSRLNSAGRHELGGGSTLDILSLASAPANSETLALAQARPNKGIILRKSVDYIRALQEFIEQQGKHARMLREEVERVTGLLEESKTHGGDLRSEEQADEQGEMKRLWPTAYGVEHTAYPRSGRDDAQHDQLPRLGLFRANYDRSDQQEGEQSSDDSPASGYPQLGPGQSPPPTLAEWLAAAHSHQQQSVKGKIDVTTAKRGSENELEGREEAMTF